MTEINKKETPMGVCHEFFDRFPLGTRKKIDLLDADFFLGFLWLKGFKIVPIDMVECECPPYD